MYGMALLAFVSILKENDCLDWICLTTTHVLQDILAILENDCVISLDGIRNTGIEQTGLFPAH